MNDEGYENITSPTYTPPKTPGPSSQTYEYGQPPKKRSPKRFLFLLGAVLLLLVVLNTLRILGSKGKEPTPTPTPSIEEFSQTAEPTVEPTPEPTPTPKAQSSIDKTTGLDRAKLSVEVQNGSGVIGAAKKASDFLKNLGYNITKIGNADNSNYKNVIIQVKSSQGDYLPVLIKDLNTEYSVGTTSSTLSATASADALVIIGK